MNEKIPNVEQDGRQLQKLKLTLWKTLFSAFMQQSTLAGPQIRSFLVLGIENLTQPHSNNVKFAKHSDSQFLW